MQIILEFNLIIVDLGQYFKQNLSQQRKQVHKFYKIKIKLFQISQSFFINIPQQSKFQKVQKLNIKSEKDKQISRPLIEQISLKRMKENKKQIVDTSEEESQQSVQSQNYQKVINNTEINKKATTLQNIQSYLEFFNDIKKIQPQQRFLPKIQLFSLIKDEISNSDAKRQSTHLTNYEIGQKRVDSKTLQQLKNFVQKSRIQIESTILKQKKFQKAPFFTQQLILLQIKQSKHCEVVDIKIHFLSYITKIRVLNHLGKSPLYHDTQIVSSGSYGNIFFINCWNQNLCIKSLPLNDQSQLKGQIDQIFTAQKLYFLQTNTIKEYFFLLLFSQLQIGPKVQTIGGFDIIIYKDSIEFATEICDQPQIKERDLNVLKESLFKIHMLQVVHRDIKPTNILFSPTFNKNVFIDFGGTEVLRDFLGQKTVARFVGTTFYCSEQVFQLLSQKQMAVDLYYNDMYGLKKFSDQITTKQKNQFSKYKLQSTELVNRGAITYIKNLDFQLIKLKYLCFQRNFEEFIKQWQRLLKKYSHWEEDIERKILQFMKEVRPYEELRQFYWRKLKQSIRQQQEFQAMKVYYRSGSAGVLFDLNMDKQKHKFFHSYRQFYFDLKILKGNITSDEVMVLKITKDKQTIQQGLKQIQSLALDSTQEIYNRNFCIYLIIVAHYCSLATNVYGLKIDEKTSICEQALKVINRNDLQNLQKRKVTFNCSIQKLQNLNLFFHYFLFNILTKVSINLRSELIIICLSSLCLLGLPIKYNPKITEILFIKSMGLDQIMQQKSMKQKQNSEIEEEERISRINMFWQFKIIVYFYFKNMFYNHKKVYSLVDQDQIYLKNISEKIFSLMTPKQIQKSKFFEINFTFYQKLYADFHNFTQPDFNQLNSKLLSQNFSQVESCYGQIEKWKQLMSLSLFYLNLAYESAFSDQIIENSKDRKVLQNCKNHLLFPYAVFYSQQTSHRKTINTENIFILIDNMINCQELSLRFQTRKRFQCALENKDKKALSKISDLILKQIDCGKVTVENIQWIRSFVLIIHFFFFQYFQSMPKINQEFFSILKYCSKIINLGLQIGISYFNSEISKKPCYQFQHLLRQNIKNDEIFNFIFNKKMIRNFILSLASSSDTYKKVLKVIHQYLQKIRNQNFPSVNSLQILKIKQHQALCFIIEKEKILNLDQKIDTFISLKNHKNNRKFIDFSQNLLDLTLNNQGLKKLIKSDRKLSFEMMVLFIQKRKNIVQLTKTNSLIEQFYGQLSSDLYKRQKWSSYLPPIEITFQYYQAKIFITNYQPYWCQQIIKMFNIFYQHDFMNKLLTEDSMIKFLFNSYVYTGASYDDIIQFLKRLSLIIKRFPTKDLINTVKNSFESTFGCQCKKCLPKNQDFWNPLKFILRLADQLNVNEVNENPYMSLVYYYNLQVKNIGYSVCRKFIGYILKSMPYLEKQTRAMLKTLIYYFRFGSVDLLIFGCLDDTDSLKNFTNRKITKQMMNQSKYRKLIYLYGELKKHQDQFTDTLEQLVKKRLIKQYIVQGYKYPSKIRGLLGKKIQKYHIVKQNFKQNSPIQKLLLEKSVVQRFSIYN